MKKNFKIISLLVFILLHLFSCEDPEDNGSGSGSDDSIGSSTLNDDDLGGMTSDLNDLFFNFDNELDYTYDFYSVSGIGTTNSINDPCLLTERDTLDFMTFPEFLVEARNCEEVDCDDEVNEDGISIDDISNFTIPTFSSEVLGNNEYDDGEEFIDEGNGIWDDGEVFTDELNGEYDEGEEFTDDNGNGTWDDGEAFTDELNGEYDDGEEFIDLGDGDYNQGESFSDSGPCTCICIDDEGEEVDCGNNAAIARVYNQIEIDGGAGSCENSNYNDQADCDLYGWIWFPDEIDCSLYDLNQDCVMDEAISENVVNVQDPTFYLTYTNLEKYSWNSESGSNGKYEATVSGEIEESITIVDTTDNYDHTTYKMIIDPNQIDVEGMVYIDHSQWVDTTITYEDPNPENEVVMETTFEYQKYILGLDSLIFRKHTDCNNDNTFTIAEPFSDVGVDGCADDEEDGCNSCGECPCNEDPTIDCDGGDPNGDNWENQADDNNPYKSESNQRYDEGEPFTDRSDGLLESEIFWDENESGNWDPGEPWADRNCNEIWDSEEIEDSGNGIWDDNEVFRDVDNSGNWTDGDFLYGMSSIPNQLIINYDTNENEIPDPEEDIDPQPLIEIGPDDINSVMVMENGEYVVYDEIITLVDFINEQDHDYTPIDSVITIYSNQVIEDVPSELIYDDYFVTKTWWDTAPDGTDVDGDGAPDRMYDYDYHLFRYNDEFHLTSLKYPEYYYHYGYFLTPDEIEENFYYNPEDLQPEVLIYTYNGELRENEIIIEYEELIGQDANGEVANYEVTKEFQVEYEDELVVPIKKHLGYMIDSGEEGNNCAYESYKVLCSNDDLWSCPDMSSSRSFNDEWDEGEDYIDENGNGEYDEGEDFTDTGFGFDPLCPADKISEVSDCPSDSTISAYKVIRTKNILMVGPGVEFGERNTIWLSEDIGIVKDMVEMRWTEGWWDDDGQQDWYEWTRLELKDYRSDSGGSDLLERMLGNVKIIKIDKFDEEDKLDNDPFHIRPTAIIQRVRIPNE